MVSFFGVRYLSSVYGIFILSICQMLSQPILPQRRWRLRRLTFVCASARLPSSWRHSARAVVQLLQQWGALLVRSRWTRPPPCCRPARSRSSSNSSSRTRCSCCNNSRSCANYSNSSRQLQQQHNRTTRIQRCWRHWWLRAVRVVAATQLLLHCKPMSTRCRRNNRRPNNSSNCSNCSSSTFSFVSNNNSSQRRRQRQRPLLQRAQQPLLQLRAVYSVNCLSPHHRNSRRNKWSLRVWPSICHRSNT